MTVSEKHRLLSEKERLTYHFNHDQLTINRLQEMMSNYCMNTQNLAENLKGNLKLWI